jgi:hypothetical protein
MYYLPLALDFWYVIAFAEMAIRDSGGNFGG